MSPVLNCVQSSPPSDQDTYPKTTNGTSNHSPPEVSGSDCVCEDERREAEEQSSQRCSPTSATITATNNNNIIPLNYKKSPSPSVSPPIRPWNSSPNFKPPERGQSVSPSSSGHRPSPCPPSRSSISPDASSENSRIPSQASSEAHDMIASSPDSFRSPKLSAPEIGSDVPFPFHDNRLPSESFRLSNSFLGDPINPYLRLPNNPLNPFQTPPGFLENPFLGSSDPKLLLNNPGLGLISQQLHHLNGFSTNLNKLHPPELQRMSMQQLQFLQTQLQSLPTLLTPPSSLYSKFPDSKNHLSMLIQARKHPKILEGDLDNVKKDVFRTISTKLEDSNTVKTVRERKDEAGLKPIGKPQEDENMDLDNYDVDNVSESDELLSVGSASPPPNCLPRANSTSEVSDPGLSTLDSSSSVFPNRTVNPSGVKKPPSSNPPAVRLQNGLTNAKTTNATNRTLKFSIDNILKSDFGNEETVKKAKVGDSKREKEGERTTAVKKKTETEKETAVDLSQDNSNNVPGTETPMLWPAWVYCTRYSDRPSSGPRTRRSKNKDKNPEEKRPRTAFSGDQLSRLKHEFAENRYLTERRRQDLARELGLNEAQIKIWFQNKRAKMKKARGEKNPLALQLMAQGLYNHSTVPLTKEEEEAAAAELSD